MVKKRRRYPKEFKLEAVQLARESERSVAEVARDLKTEFSTGIRVFDQ